MKHLLLISSVVLTFITSLAVPSIPSAHATGNTYYVATTGDDTLSCTTATNIGTPLKTINKGVTCLTPGATLYIRAGTYQEPALYNAIPSGTDWNSPVTVAAYPGEQVTFKPNSGYGVIWMLNNPYHHIIIDGLIMDAATTGSTVILLGQSGGSIADVTKLPHDIRIQNGFVE